MKTLLLFLVVSMCCTYLSYSQVKVQFNTINGYGNNLYIDNFTVGNRFDTDIAIVGILNINPDTSYTIGSAPFIVAPQVAFINLGRNNITSSFTVTMQVNPGGYISNKTISSINSGQTTTVTFDNLTITPNQATNITVNANLTGDQNTSNNSLTQYTIYLSGF